MPKEPGSWIDLDTDAVQLARMFCRELEDKDRVRPFTDKAKRLAYKMAGLYLAPANEEGVRYVKHTRNWDRESLRRFGIDPRTYQLVDKTKLEVLRIEQEAQERKLAEAKADHHEAIAKAIKQYQAPAQSPAEIIGNLKLDKAIKKKIIRHDEGWDDEPPLT